MTRLMQLVSFGAAAVFATNMSVTGLAQTPADTIQGTWVAISAQGKDLPLGLHAGLVIAGTAYQGMENGKVNERGTITVSTAKKPWTVDLTILEGSFAGKTQLGLIEVNADTMTVVLSEPGATTRPTSLAKETLTLARIKPVPKELEGTWSGVLDAAGQKMRMSVRLSNGADGLAIGTLISVDQGNREAPITAVIIRGARVTLLMPAIRGGYDAQLKGGKLTGSWSQPGGSVPLVLQR